MRNAWFYLFIFTFYLLNFIGCVPSPYVKGIAPPGLPGIYHRVEKGQTLWRISKLYDVELEQIATINHISDATKIESGQLIFIPNRQRQIPAFNKYSSDDFIWPVRGKVIATFGQTFNNMLNKGINIQPYNNPDVVAARSGRVVFYKDNFGYFGKTLIIEHSDGFSTVYAGNAQVFVRVGENVEKGSVIAKAKQLHFEIRKGYTPQNPFFYLP